MENKTLFTRINLDFRLIGTILSLIMSFNLCGQNWVKLKEMSFARMSFGLVPFNNKLYAIGGEGVYAGNEKPTYLNIVEEYDPQTNSWTRKKDMPISLSFTRTAVVGEKIYVLGGETNDYKYSATVYEFDPQEDTWTEKTHIPESFSLFGALNSVVIDSCIYLQSENHLYSYNPYQNKWNSVTLDRKLPTLNYLAVKDDKIWSLAGSEDAQETTEIHEYDKGLNAWTKINNIPDARSEHSALIINNKLFVIGGYNRQQGLLSDFRTLNIDNSQWKRLKNMPTGLHFPGVANINHKIYLAGGAYGLFRFDGHQKTLYMYDTELTTDVSTIKVDDFQVFPNPVINNKIQISTPTYRGKLNYCLFNNSDQILLKNSVNFVNYIIELDLPKLSTGIYYLNIESADKRYLKKLLVP
jgi:N-acetylneuraminic acid mutarotase